MSITRKKCRWTVFKSVGELSSNLSVNCLQKPCRWIVLSVNCLVPKTLTHPFWKNGLQPCLSWYTGTIEFNHYALCRGWGITRFTQPENVLKLKHGWTLLQGYTYWRQWHHLHLTEVTKQIRWSLTSLICSTEFRINDFYGNSTITASEDTYLHSCLSWITSFLTGRSQLLLSKVQNWKVYQWSAEPPRLSAQSVTVPLVHQRPSGQHRI